MGSLALPKFEDGPLYATLVSTGLLSCRPNRLPPGCTAEYRLAVDKASPCANLVLAVGSPRLNELAVFAFCAEITRLPGHCEPRSAPENATAQTTPSRSTTVAHIWKSRPLVSTATALTSAAFNCAWLGSPTHPPDSSLSANAP